MVKLNLDFDLPGDPGDQLKMIAALLRLQVNTSDEAFNVLTQELRTNQRHLSPEGRQIVTNVLELYTEGMETKRRPG